MLQRLVGDRALVSVSGLCGELTEDMARRFSREVRARKPQFVVILGGTNDLGCDVPVQDVAANLCAMYDRARQAGAEPIAVTVPSLRPFEPPAPREATSWLAEHRRRRRELNGLIATSCADRHMACVDLFTATCEGPDQLLAARFSNDGLHLTTEGYDCLARLLFDQVFHAEFCGRDETAE